MEALEIFRMVATEFASMPDEDVRDPDTGQITAYGVRSFLALYADQISEKRFGSTYQNKCRSKRYACAAYCRITVF